ncbi:MAG: hypothetical protein JO015_03150 [Verrucomicrobia bacterium]|nr:hypothetical protein [Verrucomicrobiota bacterium]
MAVSCFYKPTRPEREGERCGSEPTPLVPLVLCILAVAVATALVQVSWASPLLGGTVLLVAVAAFRNGIEDARQEVAATEAQSAQATPPEPSRPAKESLEPPFQKPARAAHRFRGDNVWGLN